jgi:hypothetical protein
MVSILKLFRERLDTLREESNGPVHLPSHSEKALRHGNKGSLLESEG